MKPSVVFATNDPSSVTSVSGVLMKRNWEVLITKSKLQSIINVLERNIAFFILDYELPDNYNSNIELISIIKTIRPKVPIIVLTSDNSLTTRKRLAEAGIFYCALKPIRENEITQLIEAIEKVSVKQVEYISIFTDRMLKIDSLSR